MKTDARYELKILQVLEDTDSLTSVNTIFDRCNHQISLSELKRMFDKMMLAGFIESYSAEYKITASGVNQRYELQLEKEYEEKVRQVPQSVIDTNIASQKNYPIQRRLVLASLIIAGASAIMAIASYLKPDSEVLKHIETQLQKQTILLDSLQQNLKTHQVHDTIFSKDDTMPNH